MNIPTRSLRRFASALFIMSSFAVISVFAQTTMFTYQGRLADASMAAIFIPKARANKNYVETAY